MSARGKALTATAVVAAILLLGSMFAVPSASGSRTPVPSGEDAVSFGKALDVRDPVDGNVLVLSAPLTIAATVSGDVISFAGDVILEEGAEIGGDLIVLGGVIRGETEGAVTGRVVTPDAVEALAGVVSESHAIERRGRAWQLLNLALKVTLLLVWMLAALVITLLAGRELRSSSLELRAAVGHNLLLGLVAFTSFILTAIVFSYLVPYYVGVLLLAVLAAFAIVAKVYGMITVFHAIGWMLFGPRRRDQLEARSWVRGDLGFVLAGLVILGLLRLIPVIGTFIWMAASVIGIGIALSTGFGRREPWFLAWKPAGR